MLLAVICSVAQQLNCERQSGLADTDAGTRLMCRLTCLQRSRIGAQRGGCTSVAVVLPHLPEEGMGLLQVLLQQHRVFVVAVECPRQVPGQRGGLLGSMSLHDQQVTLRFAKGGERQ